MRKLLDAYGLPRLIVHLAMLIGLSAAPPAFAQQKLIVAFGDSLIAGYGLKPGESFPAQLQTALNGGGVKARVHNAGVSGDTSAAGKARMAWVLNSLKAKPDLVILELGANDMLRGIKPAQTRANLDAMIVELKRRGIRVLLAGMLAAPNMGAAYRGQFDPIYPQLAKKHAIPLYPFFMKGVTGNRALLLKDGMHPTAAGVGIVVRGILPSVRAGLR